MLAVKSMDVRENFKTFCDKVFRGETLIISRPKNENIVMMSEKEYNDIMKAKHNVEYSICWTNLWQKPKKAGLSLRQLMSWENMNNEGNIYIHCLAAIYSDIVHKMDKKILRNLFGKILEKFFQNL